MVVRWRDAANLKVVKLSDAWTRLLLLLLCMRSYDDLPGYARKLVDALAGQASQPETS